MKKQIILASSNPGKIREINQILAQSAYEVQPQTAFNLVPAEETGLSFVENAILKARHAAVNTHLPAMADDSGLEVDYLNGAPGIYSARFAGPQATDQQNLDYLLERLQDIPEPERTARFHCVIVYLRHAQDPVPLICQGSWEGRILFAPKGEHGFGYDPIFYVPTHDCASAELLPEIKNQISHRAQALRTLQLALQ